MTYEEFCNLKSNDPMENIFPKGTSAEEAMSILESTFVGHTTCAPYSDIAKGIISQCKRRHNTDFNTIHGIEAQEAVDLLREELLPKDWYIDYPCRNLQYNTEVVGYILDKYSNKYYYKDSIFKRIKHIFS